MLTVKQLQEVTVILEKRKTITIKYFITDSTSRSMVSGYYFTYKLNINKITDMPLNVTHRPTDPLGTFC